MGENDLKKQRRTARCHVIVNMFNMESDEKKNQQNFARTVCKMTDFLSKILRIYLIVAAYLSASEKVIFHSSVISKSVTILNYCLVACH